MITHILQAAAVVLALVVLVAIAMYGRAVILAATRHGRHELTEADAELQQPSEDDVHDFLEELPSWEQNTRPAPGRTIYDDPKVRLPWTPPACGNWSPGREFYCTRYAGHVGWCADENGNGTVRWPRTEPEPVVADITEVRGRGDAPRPVLPGCDLCGSYSHWTAGHDTATSKLHAPQPEPVTTTDLAVPDSTFVQALFALPLSRVYEAFEGVRQ